MAGRQSMSDKFCREVNRKSRLRRILLRKLIQSNRVVASQSIIHSFSEGKKKRRRNGICQSDINREHNRPIEVETTEKWEKKWKNVHTRTIRIHLCTKRSSLLRSLHWLQRSGAPFGTKQKRIQANAIAFFVLRFSCHFIFMFISRKMSPLTVFFPLKLMGTSRLDWAIRSEQDEEKQMPTACFAMIVHDRGHVHCEPLNKICHPQRKTRRCRCWHARVRTHHTSDRFTANATSFALFKFATYWSNGRSSASRRQEGTTNKQTCTIMC